MNSREWIPDVLPSVKKYELSINHAPKRKSILSADEKKLALRNALRYFDVKHHKILLPEFADELEKDLRSYPKIKENAETVIYKIKYSRTYVFIKIIRKGNGEEIISVRSSKDPQ